MKIFIKSTFAKTYYLEIDTWKKIYYRKENPQLYIPLSFSGWQ